MKDDGYSGDRQRERDSEGEKLRQWKQMEKHKGRDRVTEKKLLLNVKKIIEWKELNETGIRSVQKEDDCQGFRIIKVTQYVE